MTEPTLPPLPPIQAEPPGWKLVPIEPTQEMKDAFYSAGNIWATDWFTQKYPAMLAASPQPQEPATPVQEIAEPTD